MGSPICYACRGKEMLGWIHEKMAIQKSASRGGRFFASSLIAIGNGAFACSGPCAIG